MDDAQRLDQVSARTLEFVARRLAAEPVGLVFAVRETDEEPKLAGLRELRVHGLGSRTRPRCWGRSCRACWIPE